MKWRVQKNVSVESGGRMYQTKKKKLWFFKAEDKDKQHNIFVLFIRCSIYSALTKTLS